MRIAWVGLVFGVFLVAACSGSPTGFDDGGDMSDGTPADDGGNPMDDGGSGMDSGMGTDTGMMMQDTGVQDTGVNDPYAAARTACINEINKLRATEGHAAYAYWQGMDMCADQQATNDEQNKSPHQAWLQNKYPTCNGNGQDECLGYGVTPKAVVQCLDAMWAEKYQSNCTGCPLCTKQYSPNCPNCDFYGQKGPECGHYVNMSADWMHKAVCGFSSLGGWAVQNFSQ